MDPKILDLGLAKVTKGGGGQVSVTIGNLGGTVGYMAPEIASGVYTVASEVYSFGVLLLELLRRRRVGPRTAVEAEELAEDEGVGALAATADPAWPSPAAEALAALVFDCLHLRPAKRPQSMVLVLARLKQIRNLVDAAGPPLVDCGICLEAVPDNTGVR